MGKYEAEMHIGCCKWWSGHFSDKSSTHIKIFATVGYLVSKVHRRKRSNLNLFRKLLVLFHKQLWKYEILIEINDVLRRKWYCETQVTIVSRKLCRKNFLVFHRFTVRHLIRVNKKGKLKDIDLNFYDKDEFFLHLHLHIAFYISRMVE